MATYDPPTEDLPIFDTSVFTSLTDGLTAAEADARYLRFPVSQGSETISGDLNVSGTSTLGVTNVSGTATINGGIFTQTSPQYKIEYPVNSGRFDFFTNTAGGVSTRGCKIDATGVHTISKFDTIDETAGTLDIGTASARTGSINIGTGNTGTGSYVSNSANYNSGNPASYSGNNISGYNAAPPPSYNVGNPATYQSNTISGYNVGNIATYTGNFTGSYSGNFASSYNPGSASTYNFPIPGTPGEPGYAFGVYFPGGSVCAPGTYVSPQSISYYFEGQEIDYKNYPVVVPPGGQIVVTVE